MATSKQYKTCSKIVFSPTSSSYLSLRKMECRNLIFLLSKIVSLAFSNFSFLPSACCAQIGYNNVWLLTYAHGCQTEVKITNNTWQISKIVPSQKVVYIKHEYWKHCCNLT